jgi:hypothetical protein
MVALTALDNSRTLSLGSLGGNTTPAKNKRKRSEKENIPQCKYQKADEGICPEGSIPSITNQFLTGRFKRGAILGRYLSDSTSMVVAVEGHINSAKVLKITNSFPPLDVLPILSAIWTSEESIHLTETVLLGKMEVRSGAYLQIDNNNGGFVHLPGARQTKKRYAYVYVMNQKTGDLKALKKKGLSVCEEAAVEVQRVATEAFLNTKGIEPVDLKDINILYELWTPEDRFRGKRILMYDYLEYKVGSQSYFLPIGPYKITLCDYDKWRLSHVKKDFSLALDERLKLAPHLLREIERFKTRPAFPCRILPVN